MAYHGTKYKFLGSILNEGLKNSKADHRDAGVYVTPVFETALGYADKEEKSHFELLEHPSSFYLLAF